MNQPADRNSLQGQPLLPPEPSPALVEDQGFFSEALRRMAQVVGRLVGQTTEPRPEDATLNTLAEWSRAAIGKAGKVAGTLAVARLAAAYRAMDSNARTDYFSLLARDFNLDPAALDAAIDRYRMGEGARSAEVMALHEALDSPRSMLFRQFNTVPGGIKLLVDLRAEVLAQLKAHPEFQLMDYELRLVLQAFFNLGFLQLKRIGWDSPASLLEKLVAYEAVHQIESWQDLKNRLISDRACYAFVHPAMPDEPLIFVEVALVQELANSVQAILSLDRPILFPEQANTAIFYSISNAQAGLRSIPFGNMLIKQVVASLRGEAPHLRTFATLSPVPRFRSAFLDREENADVLESCFTRPERQALLQTAGGGERVFEAVQAILAVRNWQRQPQLEAALRPGLLRALRHYLLETRYNGHAACPVAHFHSSNGAVLARINWLGDTSANGLKQSAGLMVNYLYDMERFERVQMDYQASGEVVAESPVRKL